MPRGQKSKLRAREKRRQALEAGNVTGPQASVEKEEESPPSSLHSTDNPDMSSAAGATSGQELEGAMAAGATAASYTSSKEDASSQVGEMLKDLQVSTEAYEEDDLVEERVARLVNYLLYKYQLKEPVTKAEILKNVIQISKNQFSKVLRKAANHLELIFGLDVKALDPNKNIYILINKMELDQDATMGDNRHIPTTGLLMTILGVIFTNGNRATEEQLWEVLNMMGIFSGSQHFFFGDATKFITHDLVKEKYLKYEQVPGSDPPCYEFLWGPKAYAKTSKMQVLEFLAKIHNTTPSSFSPYYEEALKDEEERAQARAAARARAGAKASSRAKVRSSSPPNPK
ncbi:PREDICTED: melanoma-associated antigen B10-like [Chinchilla lanigera]|uniref:melanoma-associated antigen B10-like n=1 Tax=Chinchilla lanigera TaxID=34839 RepID=UPI00038EE7D7|nr:PREDICTED: melanoma-associated antigen B10-like [Chinchilla lanigera]